MGRSVTIRKIIECIKDCLRGKSESAKAPSSMPWKVVVTKIDARAKDDALPAFWLSEREIHGLDEC